MQSAVNALSVFVRVIITISPTVEFSLRVSHRYVHDYIDTL